MTVLVLSRRLEESIIIGDDVKVTVLGVTGSGKGAKVKLGIEAPESIGIYREEIYEEVAEANVQAASAGSLKALQQALERLQGHQEDDEGTKEEVNGRRSDEQGENR